MALRTSRQPTGRTNLQQQRPFTSYETGRARSPGRIPGSPTLQVGQMSPERSRGSQRLYQQKSPDFHESRPVTSQEVKNRRLFSSASQGHIGNRNSRNLQSSASRIFQNQSPKKAGWHSDLGEDHDPWSAGLDTQRIAHELEWDDQQLDEENMTPARMARAKAFAVHHFVSKELDPSTLRMTPALQGLDEQGIVDHFSKTNAFSKNLREIKYINRRLATKNSSNVANCLSLPEVGGVNAVDMFDVNEVDAKPYSTGVFSKSSTGVKSCKELKYMRSQENLKAGADWLAKDESYVKPGVSFKRVAAYSRDTYITR